MYKGRWGSSGSSAFSFHIWVLSPKPNRLMDGHHVDTRASACIRRKERLCFPRACRIATWLPLQLSLSAFETAQVQGFWSQSLGQAWFPTQGRLLHVIGQKTLDLGRIGVRNSPDWLDRGLGYKPPLVSTIFFSARFFWFQPGFFWFFWVSAAPFLG